MMTTNTISTHPKDDSVGTFRNSVALLWPLWLEGRCHASNVEVVARDLFTTRNLLKSHAERNLLFPYSNIRAITSKLCARVRAWRSSKTTAFEIFAVGRYATGAAAR